MLFCSILSLFRLVILLHLLSPFISFEILCFFSCRTFFFYQILHFILQYYKCNVSTFIYFLFIKLTETEWSIDKFIYYFYFFLHSTIQYELLESNGMIKCTFSYEMEKQINRTVEYNIWMFATQHKIVLFWLIHML